MDNKSSGKTNLLTLLGTPKILLAHYYDSNEYEHSISASLVNPNRFEISYILSGDVTVSTLSRDGNVTETAHIRPDTVLLTVYDSPRHFCAEGYHRHVTVSFTVENSFCRISEDMVGNSTNGIFLPTFLSYDTRKNPILPIFEQLILAHTQDSSSPLCTSLLYKLIGTLSSEYLTKHVATESNAKYGDKYYVGKAQKYIAKNLAAPIRVSDVAEHLGISSGYLSHIFRSTINQSVVEYINTVKVKKIEELILTYGCTVKDAGIQVGLGDPNYTSRLFRRIRGYTPTELLRSQYPK